MIFFLAGLPQENYEKLLQVFSLYEAGKLCKLPKTKQGLLSGTAECAPSNFKGLRNLSEEIISDILDKVVAKKNEFKKIGLECRKVKEMKKMKEVFSSQTGVKDWSAAQKSFPYHATDDKLLPFAGKAFNSKDQPSTDFLAFCRKAIASKHDGVVNTSPATSSVSYKIKDLTCNCFLFNVSKPTDLSYSTLMTCVPGFSGPRLICASINIQYSVS